MPLNGERLYWWPFKFENKMVSSNLTAARRAVKTPCSVRPILAVAMAVSLVMPVTASAKDTISKLLLIKMARETSGTLCQSEIFTQCMGLTVARCDELNEAAITTCLEPLPDSINPGELQNSTLEACPQKIYSDAGFTEEKANVCFDKAMAALPPVGVDAPKTDSTTD